MSPPSRRTPTRRRRAVLLAATLAVATAGVAPVTAEELFTEPTLGLTLRVPDRWVRITEGRRSEIVGTFWRYRHDRDTPASLHVTRTGKLLPPAQADYSDAEIAQASRPPQRPGGDSLTYSAMEFRWAGGTLRGCRWEQHAGVLSSRGFAVRVPLAPEAVGISIEGLPDEADLDTVLQSVLDSLEATSYRPRSASLWLLFPILLAALALALFWKRLLPVARDFRDRLTPPRAGALPRRAAAPRSSRSGSTSARRTKPDEHR